MAPPSELGNAGIHHPTGHSWQVAPQQSLLPLRRIKYIVPNKNISVNRGRIEVAKHFYTPFNKTEMQLKKYSKKSRNTRASSSRISKSNMKAPRMNLSRSQSSREKILVAVAPNVTDRTLLMTPTGVRGGFSLSPCGRFPSGSCTGCDGSNARNTAF